MAAMTAMCRLSIRSALTEVDVELPADLAVAELLPTVVDLVGEIPFPGSLRLARPDGTVVDVRASLAECGVHDGDVLFLVPVDLPDPPVPVEVGAAVAQLREQGGRAVPDWATAVLVTAWSAIAVVTALCVGSRTTGVSLVFATAAIAFTLWAAVRVRRHRTASTGLGVIAAVVGTVSAWGMVPGLAGGMLGSSALAGVALVAWRVLDHGAQVFVPLSGVGLASAATAAAVMSDVLPAAAAGSLVGTAAVAVLAVSPRWSLRAGGVSPSAHPQDLQSGVVRARSTLAATVAAAAGVGMSGVMMTAAWSAEPGWAATFTGLLSAEFLLRSRFHQGCPSWWVMMSAAASAATVSTGLLTRSAPWATGWVCAAVLTVAAGTVVGSTAAARSVLAARALGILDVVVGAAVVPAACAAAGVFTAIGALR